MNNLDKKIFTAIFFSIFSAVMGVGIVVPLLPIYAENLGASGLYISFIFTAFSLSRTFLLPLFGGLSDRTGRKPYLACGLLGYAVVSVAFLFADTVPSLIGVRFVQGIASAMIMPVAQAYIGDITPPNREGFTMGLFNLSMFIGLSLGPLAGGRLNDTWGMDAAFISMGLLSLIGFGLIIFFLPPVSQEKKDNQQTVSLSWAALIKDRLICGLFVLRFVYVFCIGTIWCFLPVFATSFGMSSTRVGVLVMLGVLISGLLQMPMGMVADRVNKNKMAAWGGFIVVASMFGYYWTNDFKSLFVVNLLFGIGGGVAMPPLMAMAVIKGSQTKAMGSVMGLLTMAHSLGMLLGGISAGLAMDYLTLRYAFPLAGIIMLFGVILFVICSYGQRSQPEY